MSEEKKSKDKKNSSDLKKRLKELEKKADKPTQITRIERLEKLQEKLEGTHEINRLKKLEKIALIPQIIIIVFLFLLSIYLKGGSLEPLYIPLYTPLIIFGLWSVVLSIELLAFKLMEIKYGRSKSSNFLLAKKSIRRATQIAVIFILIFTILFVPYFTDKISEMSSINNEIDLEKGEEKVIEFNTKGHFNFLATRNITVEILSYGQEKLEENATVEVHLYSKSDYKKGDKNLSINNDKDDLVTAKLDKKFRYQYSEREFEENVLWMKANQDLTVEYKIEKTMTKNKNYYFSTISFSIALTCIGWIFSLQTVKKEQTKEAIYH